MGKSRLELLWGAVVCCVIAAGVVAAPAYALSPSVGSKAASNIDYSTATFNGTVNPNGLETKTYFEYGPTTSYGSKTAEVSVGSGSNALEIAKAVSGLTANTTYHYRVVATNADGTSTGGDRTLYVGWALQTVANPTATTVFHDVYCSSATECTAVGGTGTDAIAQRWNGSEWKAQAVPKPAGSTEAVLLGVSCPSSSSCTAVGRYKNSSGAWLTLVELWNGTEWKIQTSPSPAGTGAQLEDISCLSASECLAVGYSWNTGPPETRQALALRWNGTEWKSQAPLNPTERSYLTSVSCVSSSFCMASGFYQEGAENVAVPLTEVWNGSGWTTKSAVKPSGATESWFHSVSCTSSTACTAVGDKIVNATTKEGQFMAQRWNGSGWSLQTTPNPEATDRDVEAVSCTIATVCTATGFYTSSSGVQTPFALKWAASTWTLQTLPLPSGSTHALPHSISCIAGRGCEVAGHFVNGSSVNVPLAGANWRKAQPTATTTAAASIGEKTATVNATVNPNGSETKLYFEYGTTTSYGSKTAEFNAGSGVSAVERGETLTGLSPATTYHYRIVANNENPATSKGSDLIFRTTGPPTVTTAAAEVQESGEAATLKGDVNPNGLSTTYQFEYGTAPGTYTTTVPVVAESAGSGIEAKAVSYEVSGLTPGKTYYYRITATNSAGKSNGGEVSFTTPVPVTLRFVEGPPLEEGASLKVFSSNFTFLSNTNVKHSCAETELSGEVAKNPGAIENVTAPKMQNAGGARCPQGTGAFWTIQYAFPSPMTLEYKGEGIVRTGKFILHGTVYFGEGKVTECEWEAELSGTLKFFTPLGLELGGSSTLLKGGSFYCYTSETMSGTFTVTSGGSAVEATL